MNGPEHLAHLRDRITSHQHFLARPALYPITEEIGPYVQIASHPEPKVSGLEWDGAKEPSLRCLKVDLHPTADQKATLKRWCNAYLLMYNATIHHIKRTYAANQRLVLNFHRLRTDHLKEIRDEIIQNSKTRPGTQVKAHMLDGAIQLACANYKTAVTNLRNGNIKHFRIRYWRRNRPFYRLDIENQYVKGTGICPVVLGPLNATYDGTEYDWSSIAHTCQIQYDRANDRFQLFVPTTVERNVPQNRQPWVSLDPGSRRFMTGISEQESLFIGEGIGSRIYDRLRRKDYIKRHPTLSAKKKERVMKRHQRKIGNIVEDLHWQVANQLTARYETILIGDLSAKRVSSRKRSCLAPISKLVLLSLSFYQFRQRLEYKASTRGSVVKVIPEQYTSKACSCCGHLHANLGSASVYMCAHCGSVMDRDINGARGICLKAI